ncbi:MAG TPA: glycosyltransferase, partial [Thermoanaerobaculia bacterium]|nr:glycosyltransferase [Thermoanaerobaculia bacterium]
MGRLVSVVLVTWNSAQWLRRCLDAIARQTHGQRELIVVDNASTDESLSLVSDATVIRNDTNRGFAAAVNQAIRAAKGEFIQLVNPDAFLAPDYIEKLLAAFEAEDVGMATGKLLRDDGSGIDSMGIRMTRTGRHLDVTEWRTGASPVGT